MTAAYAIEPSSQKSGATQKTNSRSEGRRQKSESPRRDVIANASAVDQTRTRRDSSVQFATTSPESQTIPPPRVPGV